LVIKFTIYHNGFAMVFKSRKLYVWLISAGAIFVIYLFYNLISRTPPIEIDTGDTTAESNTVVSDGRVGKVGDVGVGTIQKAKYTHLNAKKRVDREFGFEKLLHAEGDEWEIEKPYMNVFQGNLKCYMTADKGTVQVENAVGKVTPKDATLTGNVVIHILPEKGSNIEEGFIYLDDVIFISDKSQFSTAGPVKFTSRDAQMLGKGLEIVYNDEQDHLEYLKIIALETLRIKQSSKASKPSLFSPETAAQKSAGPSNGAQAAQQKTKETPAADREAIGKKKAAYYKCVFRKNVTIDGPEQLVLADEVSIDDILWSKSSDVNSDNKTTGNTTTAEVTEKSAASPQSEPNKSPEQFVDLSEAADANSNIVVTCDDGIIVVPMDSSETPATESKALKSVNDEKGRPTFVARKIDYSMVTGEAFASGPSELNFYTNDVMGPGGTPTPREKIAGKPAVPVKVTAQEKARFLPTLNQAIFEGNVLCTMLREETDFRQKYALSSSKLTVDLSRSREASPTADKRSQANVKHLTATGDVVQLDTSKWAGEKLLGFTKLKCLQFDYDANQQMFLATGSGIIAVDNSKIAEPAKEVGRFSLQRPCYAVMRNFDALKYLKDANLIIADAGAEQILIDYFPVIKGQQGQQTSATSNHVEAVLSETANGQNELSTLSAKGGITYEEEREKKGKTVQFAGSEMFYDGGKSMITAWGDESQPCFLNGALAPGIEYNLKTDRVKTKIIGPGMLQMGR